VSRRDDFPYEMFGSWLDQDTADRLLGGRIHPDDAPPGFAGVARTTAALAAPSAAGELVGERAAVAAAVLVPADPAPTPADTRRWRMRSNLSRAKVAGLIVVGTLVGTTGMAAANVLPDPAQNAVSNVLSRVGISVPNASADATTVDATTVDHPAATGEEISQLATTTDATGVAKGAEISTAASGGMSQAGVNSGAAAETPSAGGTGDGAGGGSDQTGSSTADQASGGHADQGLANAPGPPSTP
jgi:hypothetical protein